jgi:acyl dehydratase
MSSDQPRLASQNRLARGVVNDDTLAAVRRRIGIPTRHRQRFHNESCSADSFRHFARGYGDDNPLYSDAEYARTSPWAGLVAPPVYPISAGKNRNVGWTDDEAEAMSGGDPLAGVGQYMCGERWVFVRPVRPGDELLRQEALYSAELKSSAFGGGQGALLSHRVSWEGRDGSPYCYRFLDFWHAEREKSAGAAKYRSLARAHYDDEDLKRIDDCYAAEEVRGPRPRLMSEVSVGDQLGPIVKGPLSLTDIICYHVATGFGGFGGGSAKIGYQARRRMPRLYQRNSYGFWDTAQRCHWEDEWAQQMGQPAAYDYGAMRTNWMVHLITNWLGDNAWLWKLSASIKKFNYMGDTHFLSGSVVAVDPSTGVAELQMHGLNQRGDVTCDGRATVILPHTADTLVTLPEFDPADVPEARAP